MSKDGELSGLSAEHHANIEEAVEIILKPFEDMQPDLNGTFYGALYMQAVVPFLCAQRSGGVSKTLRATVQRVGRAMVTRYHASLIPSRFKAGALENMHVEYIEQTHLPVWGSRDDDVVWQYFYASEQQKSQNRQPGVPQRSSLSVLVACIFSPLMILLVLILARFL